MKRLFLSLVVCCLAFNSFVSPASFAKNQKTRLKSLDIRLNNRKRQEGNEWHVLYIVPLAEDVENYITMTVIEKNGTAWYLMPNRWKVVREKNGKIQFLVEADTIYKLEIPWDFFEKIIIESGNGPLTVNGEFKAHYIDSNGKSLDKSRVRRDVKTNDTKVEKLFLFNGWVRKHVEEKPKRIFKMSELIELSEGSEHAD